MAVEAVLMMRYSREREEGSMARVGEAREQQLGFFLPIRAVRSSGEGLERLLRFGLAVEPQEANRPVVRGLGGEAASRVRREIPVPGAEGRRGVFFHEVGTMCLLVRGELGRVSGRLVATRGGNDASLGRRGRERARGRRRRGRSGERGRRGLRAHVLRGGRGRRSHRPGRGGDLAGRDPSRHPADRRAGPPACRTPRPPRRRRTAPRSWYRPPAGFSIASTPARARRAATTRCRRARP